LIETGKAEELKALLDGDSDKKRVLTEINASDKGKIVCERDGRLYSALAFACNINQTDSFKILFHHARKMSTDTLANLVKSWLGDEGVQLDCLYSAIYHGNFELLRFLVNDVGVEAHKLKDDEEKSVLHKAAELGKDLMIYFLGDLGVKVNQADKNGNTPLHLAVANHRTSSVSLLLSMGADIATANREGNTPLHAAVIVGNARSTKDLLLKGADRKTRNNEGKKPIDLTAELDAAQRKRFKGYLVSTPSTSIVF